MSDEEAVEPGENPPAEGVCSLRLVIVVVIM